MSNLTSESFYFDSYFSNSSDLFEPKSWYIESSFNLSAAASCSYYSLSFSAVDNSFNGELRVLSACGYDWSKFKLIKSEFATSSSWCN